MPEADFEVIRRSWEAFSRENEAASRETLHPEIEVVPFGATIEGEVYRGPDEVIAWWRDEILEHWEFWRTIPEDFRRVGERVLVTGHWHARAKASGVEVEIPATWVVEVRDGKIVSWRTYTERAEAFRELGLKD